MLTLKEFIDSLPETTAYRPTLVRLSNQINEMKQRDAEFLRQEKNKLQKRLTDVRELEEKQVSDWIDRMMTGAVLKVKSKDLTENEKSAINEVMETYLLKQLQQYQDRSSAKKKNTTSNLYKLADAAYNTHQYIKEYDERKFLEILKSFKNLEEIFRVDYAKSSEKRIDDLKERIYQLEDYLGIDHGADPSTSVMVHQSQVPKVNAAARKKRKVSGSD